MKGTRHTDSTRLFAMALLVCGMMLTSVQLFAQHPAPSAQQQYPTQQPGQDPAQQQQPRQAPDQSAQTPDSQAQSQSAGVQVFTGTIVKSGDKYVFQDSASNATYDIDHQNEVKQFEGKKVRVHGTLDSSGKIIHVQ